MTEKEILILVQVIEAMRPQLPVLRKTLNVPATTSEEEAKALGTLRGRETIQKFIEKASGTIRCGVCGKPMIGYNLATLTHLPHVTHWLLPFCGSVAVDCERKTRILADFMPADFARSLRGPLPEQRTIPALFSLHWANEKNEPQHSLLSDGLWLCLKESDLVHLDIAGTLQSPLDVQLEYQQVQTEQRILTRFRTAVHKMAMRCSQCGTAPKQAIDVP